MKVEDGQVVVTRPNDLKKMKSLHGLTRTLISNMVTGVQDVYKRQRLNKKEKRLALKSVLTNCVNENKFIVLDELKFDEIKTKKMQAVLDALNVSKALIVLNENDRCV